MSYEIIEKLKKEIAGYKDETDWEEIGRVVETGDGIVKIFGLSGALSQELLTITTSEGAVSAVALNLEEDSIGALVLGDHLAVKTGDVVRGTGEVLSLAVGDEIVGRVIDPLGNPTDGKGALYTAKSKTERRFLEHPAPDVLARQSVREPLHTGIKAIDAMIPIGRGQRELIIGDRQTGKTAIALDTILNQQRDETGKTPVCIYVAIGQRESKIAKILEMLRERGALEYTIIVSAPASSPAAQWYLAPFAGCAIGEYFRDRGDDAVVIYDDLSKHAWAYRQVSLLLRRPPGREAYPGDVFYLHARLLERAAKLSEERGGGSLTALPIIETQLGDVTAYIPTNVISITDGQIYLESDLFYQGVRPAINVGLSVSRVGSSAQTKAMKRVAGKLRLALAQFRELAAFVQFASDVDEETRLKIERGQRVTEALKQRDLEPVPFEKQTVVLYAALNNYFDALPLERVQEAAAGLVEYIEKLHGDDILAPILASGDFTDEVEAKLKAAITSFVEGQLKVATS